jgi:hypothetical protein
VTETLASPAATCVACVECEEPLVLSLVFAKPDEPAEAAHAHASTPLAGCAAAPESGARINLATKAAAKAPAHSVAANSRPTETVANSVANSRSVVKELVSTVSLGAPAPVLAARPLSACSSSSRSRCRRYPFYPAPGVPPAST